MILQNQTLKTEFILLGFSDLSLPVQQFLCVLLLLVYMLAVTGNLLVFTILTVDPVLHTPMYFFLRNLSFVEMFLTTITVPKTLMNLLTDDGSISFLGCALQMYFFLLFANEECVLLCIMAYDRYVAICNPLRYSIVMSNIRCIYIAMGSWIMCILFQFGQVTFIFSLPFCKSNKIHHFFCDISPVLKLSCTDTYLNDIVRMTASVLFLLMPFVIILSSYIYIFSTVMKMNSKAGRSKAFSTCIAHITTVTLFYGTAMLVYLQPSEGYVDERVFAICYCLINPLLNPLIYSLRSKEVKGSLKRKIWDKVLFLFKLRHIF
ncbi:olfactory receptor 10A4-like [Microcaecilia unicolor]|uniref:Olfactory receptor 10A4-like n=1 Tax=Microcaecilia unicolor TaxID=1415580 RepID=A0A6P7WN57_9AMPH|nr:olfactory receptor 10A4-like [Microcaecilia unicolor]